ncbi:outer membrane transport energization protein TonB [Algoriphagus boseongensis]|uniref:Outer membrane transport energization protein TonB n=1 Tax=Algoriphagus boseongensis TaxID=1442587 RepID=A0A4R6T7T2_9BACT|nr:outer membrane transport energization protein TonB [Algoriphagus boseongensis]
MNAIFTYLLEASICLAISLGLYRVLFSGLTFFSWNRTVLLVILGLSFCIPLLSFEGFVIQSTAVREFTLPTFQVGEGVSAESSTWTWTQVLFGIYLLGATFVAARLIFGFMISQRLIGKAKLTRFETHWVAVHPEFIPASFFDYILMPEFDPQDPKQKQILAHESVHVRLKHSWDLLLVNFAKVVFWFNPLVYLFEKCLREVHEYQADQGVTSQVSPKEYATLLLQLISAKPGWQFMNNFNQFQTKKRILMLTKTNSRPQQKARFLALIPAIALLVFVFSCEITPEQEIEGPTQEAKGPSLGPSDLSARISAEADEVFDITEVMPEPPGGMSGWNNYLAKNLNYPKQARELGIEGTVIVVFVINQDGSIRDAEILRGIGGGADEEAMRVVMESPKWTPAFQRGRAVASRMRLPVSFKLAGSENTASVPELSSNEKAIPETNGPTVVAHGYPLKTKTN